MPQLYQAKHDCCGCSACADICPKDAISVVRYDGFDYPRIDPQKCVECGLCTKVCAFQREKDENSNCLAAYACRHNDAVRKHSSSGGIFTALSDRVLEDGGVVYGAAFDESMELRHIRATDASQRNRMRGSKYIQSNTAGIYRQVKSDLKQGLRVLFVGTPCQVAALKAYLGKDYKNLICVDVICHGVPSPEVWHKFVVYLENKYRGKLIHYSFRNKDIAWRRYSPTAVFADSRTIGANDYTGSFIELFRYDVCMRPACTACRFASVQREGDLTIGDFWGIENVMPQINDEKGVSAVMVNSQKGLAILRETEPEVELYACTQEAIGVRQPNLYAPSQFSNKAAAFQKDFAEKPFETILKKYTRVGLKRRLIDRVKSMMGR